MPMAALSQSDYMQQQSIAKLQRRIEEYKKQLRTGGQALLQQEKPKEEANNGLEYFQNSEDEERFMIELQREIDWLGTELQAMQNHLHLLEAKTISSQVSSYSVAVDEFEGTFQQVIKQNEPMKGQVVENGVRSQALTSLWEQLRVEKNMIDKVYGLAKSSNDKLEDLMRIQSENNSLDSSKLAQLFENWSPFPSPRGLDSKYEKFPPPKVLGRTSAVPGRHKSEPLNLETEDDQSSVAFSTPPSDSCSPLGTANLNPKAPPPFYDENAVSSGSVSIFGKNSLTSYDGGYESLSSFKTMSRGRREAIINSQSLGNLDQEVRGIQRYYKPSNPDFPRTQTSEDSDRRASGKFETLVWRGPRKPKSRRESSDSQDTYVRRSRTLHSAEFFNELEESYEPEDKDAPQPALKPLPPKPEHRSQQLSVGQAERAISHWQQEPETSQNVVVSSRSAVQMPKNYSEQELERGIENPNSKLKEGETIEEAMEAALKEWEASQRPILASQRRNSLDIAHKSMKVGEIDSIFDEKRPKAKKWGMTLLKGIAKNFGYNKKREESQETILGDFSLHHEHNQSTADSLEGSIVRHPSPEIERVPGFKTMGTGEILDEVRSFSILPGIPTDLESSQPEAPEATETEAPKSFWEKQKARSAVLLPKFFSIGEENERKSEGRLRLTRRKSLQKVSEDNDDLAVLPNEEKKGWSMNLGGIAKKWGSSRPHEPVNIFPSNEKQSDSPGARQSSFSNLPEVPERKKSSQWRSKARQARRGKDKKDEEWNSPKASTGEADELVRSKTKQMSRKNILRSLKGSDVISLPSRDPDKGWSKILSREQRAKTNSEESVPEPNSKAQSSLFAPRTMSESETLNAPKYPLARRNSASSWLEDAIDNYHAQAEAETSYQSEEQRRSQNRDSREEKVQRERSEEREGSWEDIPPKPPRSAVFDKPPIPQRSTRSFSLSLPPRPKDDKSPLGSQHRNSGSFRNAVSAAVSQQPRDPWRQSTPFKGSRSKSGQLSSSQVDSWQSGGPSSRSKSGQLLGYAAQRRSGQLVSRNVKFPRVSSSGSGPQRCTSERSTSWTHFETQGVEYDASDGRTNWDLEEIIRPVSRSGSLPGILPGRGTQEGDDQDWEANGRSRMRRRNTMSGSLQNALKLQGKGRNWAVNLLRGMGSSSKEREAAFGGSGEFLEDFNPLDELSVDPNEFISTSRSFSSAPNPSAFPDEESPEPEFTAEMQLAGQYWRRPTELAEVLLRCMISVYRLSAEEPESAVQLATGRPSMSRELGKQSRQTGNFLSGYPRLPSRSYSGPMRSVSGHLNVKKTIPSDPYGCLGNHPCSYAGDYSKMVSVLRPPISHRQTPQQVEGLRQYELLVQQLDTVDPSGLTHEEKLAFWINLYNSLLMHTFTIHGPPSTLSGSRAILSKSFVKVGGCTISALEIEHSILRVNSRMSFTGNPGRCLSFTDKTDAFDPLDIRSGWVLDRTEPLVIFGICQGCRSTPALRVYSAANVRSELEKSRVMFLLASVGLTASGKVLVPKLLEWHSSDFVSDPSNLVDWIVSGIPDPQRFVIKKAVAKLKQEQQQQIHEIIPYDWSFRYLIDSS